MKVSLITATFNSEKTIRRTLQSVVAQSHHNVEHIVVDGGSTDSTVQIVKEFPHIKVLISEPDRGIYDALNKGLDRASGEVVGLLHSDDVFHHRLSLSRVVSALIEHPDWSGIYADIRFVDEKGETSRLYSCEDWTFSDFSRGIMPAHPAFFARREVYEGQRFSLAYRIASDFELLVRLFGDPRWKFGYIPFIITDMNGGGLSTRSWRSNFIINREIRDICRKHNIPTSYLKIYSKYWQRLLELR
ncbi:MAG: glycosyltransferase [Flavobacteriales bacterium]|nr:glycosyltransferase [Flavobacteriales bacterium]